MKNIAFHLQLNENKSWNMSRLHFHDHIELFLPLTSPGDIFVNDQVYPLDRGTLYLIGASTLHRTIAVESHTRYVLHINSVVLDRLSTPQTDFTRLTRENFRRAQLNPDQMRQVVELFQDLERNTNDGNYGSDLMQISALLKLLIYVTPTLTTASAGEAVPSRDFLRVEPILQYIRNNLSEPLNLDQIAATFFISKHYLCRVFKAATGFSVMEYIIHSRILRARQMLQEGHSVQEAGELSGFSDNSHFIRTFRNLTGTSPGRYAKEYQSSDQIMLREDALHQQ